MIHLPAADVASPLAGVSQAAPAADSGLTASPRSRAIATIASELQIGHLKAVDLLAAKRMTVSSCVSICISVLIVDRPSFWLPGSAKIAAHTGFLLGDSRPDRTEKS
jgi:hypothetical protein